MSACGTVGGMVPFGHFAGALALHSSVGVAGVEEPSRQAFGHQMIGMTAKADLEGSVNFDWREDGLVVALRFPVAP